MEGIPIKSRRAEIIKTMVITVLLAVLVLWIMLKLVFPMKISYQWRVLVLDPRAESQIVDRVELPFMGTWMPTILQDKENYPYVGELTVRRGGAEKVTPLYAAKSPAQNGWRSLFCFSQVVNGTKRVELWDMQVEQAFYAWGGKQTMAVLKAGDGGRLLLAAAEGSIGDEKLIAMAQTLWQ